MKKIILAFALVLAATAAGAEQQTRLYGPDGRSVGTAVPLLNGSVRYYGPDGRSLGTSTTTSTGTTFYDARGSVTGRTSTPGARR